MENIDQLLKELYMFSDCILTLNDSLIDFSSVETFEEKNHLKLPNDYKYFLSKHNGIDLMGVTVYGFNDSEESISDVYNFEHFEVEYPQYSFLVPFSPDGGGNFYCFDTSKPSKNSCKIIFWESNYEYTADDMPEVVNSSFAEWIKQVVLDWTLEDYDYNGNKK